MNGLVLIGGGGHCKSIIDSLLENNNYDDIVITDPGAEVGSKIMGIELVGTDDCLKELYEKGYKDAFISIGSIKNTIVRRKIYDNAKIIGFSFPSIIDKTAIVSRFSHIDSGVFIGKNAVVNAEAHIGKQCIINSSSLIEHECLIGDFTHVAVGAVICGKVNVGNDCFIGANATVIHEISIGERAVVAAGSIITKNLDGNAIYIGKN